MFMNFFHKYSTMLIIGSKAINFGCERVLSVRKGDQHNQS